MAGSDAKTRPKRSLLAWLSLLMAKRGWSHRTPHNGLRRRLWALAGHRPWWDWGGPLMILTGTDHGGNWSEPEPPTWWYRPTGTKRMWRTGYPRDVLSIVTSYDEYRRLTDGLSEDEAEKWQAIGFDQDGQLVLGRRWWGGRFYGLPAQDVKVVRRYLRMAHRHGWYGLRPWLYSQGLHASVHRKRPRACQATPPPGQGGYPHWYCGLPRNHDGFHRVGAYTWGEVGGEPIGTLYTPAEAPDA